MIMTMELMRRNDRLATPTDSDCRFGTGGRKILKNPKNTQNTKNTKSLKGPNCKEPTTICENSRCKATGPSSKNKTFLENG
jgi:hypothetical protein